jgi:alkylation response protein AidB-like acyl-CoA dehydrogenase
MGTFFAQIRFSLYRQIGMETFPELENARALAREISSRSREFELARRMPPDVAGKFAAAGLFRIAIAKDYGGAERHPADLIRVIEEVSRVEGSIGWRIAAFLKRPASCFSEWRRNHFSSRTRATKGDRRWLKWEFTKRCVPLRQYGG